MKKIAADWEEEIAFLRIEDRVEPVKAMCTIICAYPLINIRLRLCQMLEESIQSPILAYDSPSEIGHTVGMVFDIIKLIEAVSVMNEMINMKKMSYMIDDQSCEE